MEPGGMLFNVSFERYKRLIDEICDHLVAVRLGFQPSTSASSRGGRKINQQRLVLSLGFGESGVEIFLPIDEHVATLF